MCASGFCTTFSIYSDTFFVNILLRCQCSSRNKHTWCKLSWKQNMSKQIYYSKNNVDKRFFIAYAEYFLLCLLYGKIPEWLQASGPLLHTKANCTFGFILIRKYAKLCIWIILHIVVIEVKQFRERVIRS